MSTPARGLIYFLRPRGEEGYPQIVIEMGAPGQAFEMAKVGDNYRVQFGSLFLVTQSRGEDQEVVVEELA